MVHTIELCRDNHNLETVLLSMYEYSTAVVCVFVSLVVSDPFEPPFTVSPRFDL
jgi:hypothetical protein